MNRGAGAEPEGTQGVVERIARDLWARAHRSPADAIREFLGETIWRAQRTAAPPDGAAYLECIRHL